MKPVFLVGFVAELEALPESIQKKFYRQIGFLLRNLRHPSLHAKKYDETHDVWQARADIHYRFYFQIDGDRYILLNIKRHKD